MDGLPIKHPVVFGEAQLTRVIEALEYHYNTGDTEDEHEINEALVLEIKPTSLLDDAQINRVIEALGYHYNTGDTLEDHEINEALIEEIQRQVHAG